jgi:hypothetical protein
MAQPAKGRARREGRRPAYAPVRRRIASLEAVRRAAQGLKGSPMTVGLVRRDIIRRDVLELHSGS